MTIFKVGPCGGEGGEPFNVDKITSIVKIGVAYSTYIHAITITYIVDGVEKSIKWGGEGGNSAEKKNEVENKINMLSYLPGPFEQFILQPDEYITSVKGYYGGFSVDGWCGVRQLKFETSNKITYGPYGSEVGYQFELPATYGKIIGFHGRSSGARLDALGVYVCKVLNICKVGPTGGSTGTGNI